MARDLLLLMPDIPHNASNAQQLQPLHFIIASLPHIIDSPNANEHLLSVLVVLRFVQNISNDPSTAMLVQLLQSTDNAQQRQLLLSLFSNTNNEQPHQLFHF